MPIYAIDGTSLSDAYDIDGIHLSQAYDINGDELLTNTVCVMTFNIQRWSGINAYTSIMNSIFNAYQPILYCGIQETGSNGVLEYIGTQFQTGIAMSGIPNRPAFLFNTSYSNHTQGIYENQGAETRGWQKCSIVVNGKTISLYNTHLQNDAPSVRIPQALELLDMLKNEEYFICTGDFNFGGKSFSDQQYITMVQPFIDEGFNMANWTSETGLVNTWFNGATVESSTQKYATDNIITSPNISIDEIIYDQRKITAQTGLEIDHIPIVAYLTVN